MTGCSLDLATITRSATSVLVSGEAIKLWIIVEPVDDLVKERVLGLLTAPSVLVGPHTVAASAHR